MSVKENRDENNLEETIGDFKVNQKSAKIRLNVHTLNKRLNESRKVDFYRNIKLVMVSLCALAVVMLISFKF